jgi:hypothetical protein
MFLIGLMVGAPLGFFAAALLAAMWRDSDHDHRDR